MSDVNIGTLVGAISLEDKYSQPVNKFVDAIGLSSKSVGALAGAAGIATGVIVGLTAAVVSLGQRGSDVADVKDGFEGLARGVNSTGDAMLGALQRGTLGTINNFDLMATGNKVLGTGLIKTTADMETMAAGAKLLGGRVGGDTAGAFETLSNSIASGKTTQLKQLGLFIDTEGAVKAYAAQLGKTPGELTKNEQAQAAANATLAALRLQLQQAGPASASFADNIAQGKVAVQNFTDNLALAIATSPVVRAGMESIGQSLQAAFGGSQQDTVRTLIGYVNTFAIGLTYVGQIGTTAATVLLTAWFAVKTVILGIVTAVSAVVTANVGFIAGIATLGEHIPIIGEKVKGFAEGARSLTDSFQAATVSLAGQTAEAAKGVVGNSDLHRTIDGLSGALVLARDKMEEVRAKQGDLAASAPTAAAGIRSIGTAAGLSSAELAMAAQASVAAFNEAAPAIVSRFQQLQGEITLANSTGLTRRLAEIDLARQAEIDGLQQYAEAYPPVYDALVTLVTEKYAGMTAAAKGHFSSVEVAAAAAGFQTRDELEQQARTAQETYERMKNSGLFSVKAVKEAHEKAKKAEAAIDNEVYLSKTQQFDMIASAASNILRQVFGKNKTAAIAAAIIDTAAAVVKALASAPPPLNYALAAAVGAAGLVQINKIRSQDAGFAMGTPDMAFMDFGRVSTVNVHENEAIINRDQGDTLAELVVGAVARREDQTAAAVRSLHEAIKDWMNIQPLLLRDAVLLGKA